MKTWNVCAYFIAIGTLWLSFSARADSVVWQGSSSNPNWDAGVTANWLDGSDLVAFTNGDNVTFDDSATYYAPSLTGALSPVSVTVNASNSYSFVGSGTLNGASNLFKTGSGTLVIDTANTFSGTVNGGNINFTSGSTLAPGAGTAGTIPYPEDEREPGAGGGQHQLR